ncbi:TIGR00730 family Rossman fold protein [Actinomadura nitritigenes]|uniref:TIGR00730 family Rossman fold protein n=1 Tax=Actinomadura nitritigenes TaxID=134602 RepID=UPI003D8FCB80
MSDKASSYADRPEEENRVRSPVRLAYGPDRSQVAELRLPIGFTPAPLVLFLDGSFWQVEHDRRNLGVADDLVARGYAVIDLQFRQIGKGGDWHTTLIDVATATDVLPALVEQAAPGRVDLKRIVYLGHSAGGDLALWVSRRHRLGSGMPGATSTRPVVAGVVALAPNCHLATAYRVRDRAVAEAHDGGTEEALGRYPATDLATLGQVEIPTVIVHGDRDELLPVAMSRRYAAASAAELIVASSTGHFDLVDPGASVWPTIVDALSRVGSRRTAGGLSRLAVFLGARNGSDPAHAEMAYAVGRALADRGIELVYGGGGAGLMGRVSQGVIDGGGRVYGVIPRFMVQREWGRVGREPGVETTVVDTMHERKALMAERAQAFLALPGGLGTLEELFEVWTWQTLALHCKPVGLLNIDGFWDPLVTLLRDIAGAGFLEHATIDQMVVGDQLDNVLERLASVAEDMRTR